MFFSLTFRIKELEEILHDANALELHLSTIPNVSQLYTTHDSLVLDVRDLSEKLKSAASSGGRLDLLMGNVTRSLTEYTVKMAEYNAIQESYKRDAVYHSLLNNLRPEYQSPRLKGF